MDCGWAEREKEDSAEERECGESITICFLNAQSIVKKMDELRAMVVMEKPEIVAVTEAWTNDTIGDAFLGLDGYELIAREDRNDTVGGRGGGVLIYAENSLHIWKIDIESSFNQVAAVKMRYRCVDVNLHCIYRSPNSNGNNDAALCSYVKEMRGINILIGDFNFPDIDWANGTAGSRGRQFYEATTEAFLEQHVEEPTHTSGNILDLVLTNKEGLVSNVRTMGRIGMSDHELIFFSVKVDKRNTSDHQTNRNYRHANFGKMRTELKDDKWDEILCGKNVNSMWELIKGRIHGQMTKHVPLRKTCKTNDPLWIDSETKTLIKKKRAAWTKWKERKTEANREEYKKWEKEVKKKIRRKKNKTEKEIVECRKTNPKKFYRYINKARATRSKIGPLKNEMGEIVIDPQEQASLLNKYFGSVFTKSTAVLPAPPPKLKEEGQLDEFEITEEKVMQTIRQLHEQSAMGPDEIPPLVVKQLESELIKPLTILFQASLKQGKIPDDWRIAIVSPIYKMKGKKAEPCNYRPVSLTCVVGKMMERIVKEQLMTYLEKNQLITEAQHGFRHGHSPQTNLIEFLNTTTKWLDKGKSFDILYFDFEKAFDKVCHERLMMKMEQMGVGGNAKKWIQDWLSGRKQRVRVNGKVSEWEQVVSSVVQGSVLGGTLFTVYVNDLVRKFPEIAELIAKLFADDTKVAQVVETNEDAERLQRIIDELSKWAKEWAMTFNVKKCKVMHVGNKNPRKKYTMNGETLIEINEEKDLGVWIEASHKPSKQCTVAAKSAHFALGQIQRSFHFRKKENLVPLYTTFVRSKIEFANAAWSPWQEGDIKVLEKVQERFVRMLSDAKGNTYEEKLNDAGLTTLRDRRKRGDMIETFKTMNGFNKVDKNEWFVLTQESARETRRTTSVTDSGVEKKLHILEQENARLEVRKNFFNVRIAKEWNDIPEEVKRQKSVNAFKGAYDRWRRQKSTPKTALQTRDRQSEDETAGTPLI